MSWMAFYFACSVPSNFKCWLYDSAEVTTEDICGIDLEQCISRNKPEFRRLRNLETRTLQVLKCQQFRNLAFALSI